MIESALWLWLVGTATLSAPLVLAALGGLLSERSGVVNIGLEGFMLVSACACALIGAATGNAFVGMLAGLTAAVILCALHGVLTQALSIDHIVSGMAINVFAVGATNFSSKAFSSLASQKSPTLIVQVYWILAVVTVLLVSWMFARTRFGLRLKAAGSDAQSSRLAGVPVTRVRILALLGTGICTGLSGALILSNAQSFSDGMTAGRGFIALAALILGGWQPWPTFGACVLFGAVSALQFQLQGTRLFGSEVPREAWTALPYLVTVIALGGFLGCRRAPAGLGKP